MTDKECIVLLLVCSNLLLSAILILLSVKL
jgi:hypothetical protein